jgi:hypothetical protein
MVNPNLENRPSHPVHPQRAQVVSTSGVLVSLCVGDVIIVCCHWCHHCLCHHCLCHHCSSIGS